VANLGRDAHPILISEDIRHRKTAISVQVAALAPLRNSGQTLHVAGSGRRGPASMRHKPSKMECVER
jgi:hypothetical protein